MAARGVDSAAWLSASFPGHCGTTSAGDAGDCLTGDRGNLGLSTSDAADWVGATHACLERCSACARCNWVSLSLKWRDCSWYHDCGAQEWSREPTCFRSGPAKPKLLPRHLSMWPPPTVAWPADATRVLQPSRVVVLQASDRPPPLALAAVLERSHSGLLRPHAALAGGKGIRALTSAVNRAFAAAHGHAYVYARILSGCGRGLAAWCQLPAVLNLLTQRSAAAELLDHRFSSAHRFSWVLAVDEDVAFNSREGFAAFLEHARNLASEQRPPAHTSTVGGGGPSRCHGRCQPAGTNDMSDSDCSSDYHVAEEPPCLMVAKEIDGWPGVNVGCRFFRNSRATHRLLDEWWAWPLRLPRAAARPYLHGFPGEQNALNDAILSNRSLRRCVHVSPNRDLYGPPGRFARHFTGVGADKEHMFFARWPSSAVEMLLAFPSWNATACDVDERRVSMPADEHGDSTLSVRVLYTAHCLETRMVSAAMRERLWPARKGAISPI